MKSVACLFLLLINCISVRANSLSIEERVAKLEEALLESESERLKLIAEVSQLKELFVVSKMQDLQHFSEQHITDNDDFLEQGTAPIVDCNVQDNLAFKWLDKVDFFCDFRYRYEKTDNHTTNYARSRHRIRARLGLNAQINSQLNAIFRLSSGNSDSPTATNQDLGSAFSSKNIWLDWAYFDYRSEQIENVNILGGKMKNPYYFPGNSDIVFDTDVSTEGLFAAYTMSHSSRLNNSINIGCFSVEERPSASDTGLLGIQNVLRLGMEKGDSFIASVGYFDYSNLKGKTALGNDTADFFGNTFSNGAYLSNYGIFDISGEILFSDSSPVMVFGEYVKNVRSSTTQDTGYLAGIACGQLKQKGDWQLTYNYRKLEDDAVIGLLTDATIGGGGTSIKGHKVSLGYQLSSNCWTLLTVYLAQRNLDDPKDHNVVTVDFDFKL